MRHIESQGECTKLKVNRIRRISGMEEKFTVVEWMYANSIGAAGTTFHYECDKKCRIERGRWCDGSRGSTYWMWNNQTNWHAGLVLDLKSVSKVSSNLQTMEKLKKSQEIRWDEYIKRMKRYRREMNKAEMSIKDWVFCIALLEGSNREEQLKMISKT